MNSFLPKHRVALFLLFFAFTFFSFSGFAQHQLPKEKLDSLEQSKSNWQQFLRNHPFMNRPYKTKKEWKELPKKDRPDLAFEQNFLMTLDPALGQVPSERISIAHATADNLLLTKAPVAGVQWTERGPNNVGGRTRALMFDPNDPTKKKVWAAGVGGGLWYTNDITVAQPTWNRISDVWDNIAISTIAYDPSNTQIMYVGTGEGFGNGGAQRGEGIWKTTDGGLNWNQLASTDPGVYNSGSHFHYVVKLVVKSDGNVYAATRGAFTNSGGILRSTDGGATWTRVLTHYVPGVSRDHASDIEVAANGDLYASFGIGATGGIYKSTNANGGASGTWANLSPNVGILGAKRIELACAPSNANVIYAVAHGGSGDVDVEWFKRSDNGGTTWSNITIPFMVDGSGNHFTRGQAWYDLILAVHPTNDQLVIVGGIDLHRSLDGGSTWTGMTHWYGGFGKPEVHADQHAISFRPGVANEMIFGNDGGVFYSTDAGNSGVSAPGFAHRNHGYNVTQFYACATKNEVNSNYFLAGAQDNGTQRFTQPQMNSTDEVSGGDGAFCHIDQVNSNIQITQYTNNNFYRSIDGGLTFPSIISEGTGHFINPSEYDSQNKILYAASDDDLLKRVTDMNATFNNADLSLSFGGGMVSSLKLNSTNDVLFLGIDNGRVYKLTNPASATPVLTRIDNGSTPITSTGWVSSIDVGANDNQVLVTYSNFGVVSVWETADGGSTWRNKEGNLPDMPIRWAIYNPNNRNQVLAATEVGVWSTDNFQPGVAGAPVWGPSNTGLAHTRCDMLKYRSADHMVLVATHGRGLYTTDIFVTNTLADFDVTPKYSCNGSLTVQCTDGSLKPNGIWAWDMNNDGTVDYTNQNPQHTYTNPGLYTVKLSVDNNASTEIKPNLIMVTSGAPLASTGCTLAANNNNGNNFGIGIFRFELGQITKSTSNNDGFYNDYSCENWTRLQLNSTYVVSVQTGPANAEGANVFIDWNNNGTFESTESVVTFPANAAGYRSASFTTPSSGVVINTPLRLRVLSRFNSIPSNACNISTYGQAEDYMVYVTPTPSATLALGAGNQTICAGQSTALKVNIVGGTSPYTIKVNDGSSDQTITNYVSGTDFSISPTSTTTYTISSVTDALNNSITGNGSVVITVNGLTSNTNSQSACGSYTWPINGLTYTQSGTYTAVSGCHTDILNLTIIPVTTNTTNHTVCDSYTWSVNGTTYTQSGTYSHVNGCHTEILNLTNNASTSNTTSATACDSYTWSVNGTTYTTSGTYTSTSTNAAGCPHVETLNLTINASTSNSTSATACDSYTWSANGTTYTTSGTYTSTSTNAAGCPHVETLNLTINASTSNTTSATACDSYTWSVNGTTFNASGTYTFTSTNAAGCPHVETLNLTINASTSNSTSATACDSYTWSANGTTYTTSGTYTSTSTNAAGCPHVETLNLTINASTSNSTSATACDSYTWSANGTTYTTSGTYTSTSTNAAGCPHVETLNLTINASTSNTTSATACDTYTWSVNGATYTTSGTYTNTSTNAAGCPHVETLNLTITPAPVCQNGGTVNALCGCDCPSGYFGALCEFALCSTTYGSSSVTACDSYTWNGTTYTASGNPTHTYVNAGGCDSIHTLNLTINFSSSNTTTATACDTYTWSVDGNTYTTSGTYTSTSTNAAGCPHVETLNLTINASTSNTTSATACDTYTWSANGTTYTSSGTYTSTSTNAAGCPHVETLILTINTSNNSTTTVTACDSYTWSCNATTYTTSGTYTCAGTGANGCPANATLNLTINTSSSNTTSATACDSYTWSCNNATYTASGTYTCTSTNASGCPHVETLNLTITPAPVCQNGGTVNALCGCDCPSGYFGALCEFALCSTTYGSSSVTACDSYTWNGTTYTASGNPTHTYVNAGGCDSIHALNLTVNFSSSNTTTAADCDSYTWSVNGTTYTSSGTYTSTSTNQAGCPHVETLNLTINASTSNTTSATACDTYTWSANGTTYTASGTYTSTSTNAAGCPHVETLNLTINASTSNSTSVTACDTYTWSVDGMTYTASGTYTFTSTNQAGCPHVETLNLTINTSNNSTTTVTACDSYTWSCNGTTYTTSGTYTCTGTGANGCPANATLNLTINASTSNTTSATACDTYTWSVNGTTYTTSGTYTNTSTNQAGCPHVETLNLTINASTSNTTSATACDSYTWSCDNATYTASGTYTCTSTNAAGCPHVETLNLTINASTSNTTSATACDTYTWSVNGTAYTASGTYTSTSTNAAGCPHVETLNLTINASTSNTTSATACDTYTWSVDGMTYTTSGTYTFTSTNQAGCPHVETLNLTINASTSNTNSATACDSYTWSANGTTYTTSGTYTSTSTNAAGCPHVETLNLTINASTSNTTSATACDTYTWSVDGMTYTTSGTYTFTSTNQAGCPHVETLNLTINASTSNTTSATACDSYTWSANGTTYTTSGTYTSTSTNAAGCPHVETLNLTINASTSNTTSATACDTYTWSVDGMTYTTSSTYTSTSTNQAGCPHVETLNLTINASTSNTTSAAACDTYTWSVNGTTYTTSGTYTSTSTNAAGCPHVETLNLTINASTSNTTTASACGSYTWSVDGNTYTASGTYNSTSTNSSGCPHVEILNLTITSGSPTVQNETACGSYTWPCNGITYTSSGTYSCGSGCNITTLNLTINSATSNSSSVTACDTYTWAVNGNTYTTSGIYTFTSTNSAGCPHMETLNLTIQASPIVTAPALSACYGSPVTLGGNPTGGVWNLPNPYLGSASSYTYYYTAPNGCTGSATASLATGVAIINNLVVNNITGISVTLNFTAVNGVGWYEVRYKPTTSSSWITSTVAVNSKVLINLIPNTAYSAQVRGFCSSSTPGPWASTSFTTNAICGTPSGLFVSNIANTTAMLNWSAVPGAGFYTVRWKLLSSSTWNSSTSTSTSKSIAGLSGGNYEFQVKTHCGNSSSPFSASSFFSTTGGSKQALPETMNPPMLFSLYPNPTHAELHIDLYCIQQEQVELLLMDASGRSLKTYHQLSEIGNNILTLPIQELGNGIYTLQIYRNGKLAHVEKVVKN